MSSARSNFKITLNGKPVTVGKLVKEGFGSIAMEKGEGERLKEGRNQCEGADSEKNPDEGSTE